MATEEYPVIKLTKNSESDYTYTEPKLLLITLNNESMAHIRLESCLTMCGIHYNSDNNPQRAVEPTKVCGSCQSVIY